MKRLNIILFSISIFLVISQESCLKRLLEKPKGGNITVDTIFHYKKQAEFAVARMYQTCIKSYLPQYSYTPRPEVLTDEVFIIHPAYDWATSGVNAGVYITGNMTPDKTCDYRFGEASGSGGHIIAKGKRFEDHYRGIRNANLVLKNIEMVTDAGEAWKDDIRGQALFCRAMQHYELFRYYGGIPIVTKPLSGDDELNIHRSSVKTVVDSIVSWCDQAALLLPTTRPSTDFGMITRLAALALKARVLLYAASPLYNTPADMATIVAGARYGDERDSVLCYLSYDKERWNKAAKASKAVIDNAASAGIGLYYTGKAKTTGDQYDDLGDYESVWNVYGNKEIILASPYNQTTISGWLPWGQYLSSKVWESKGGNWGVKNNTPLEFLGLYEKQDGTNWTMPETGDDLPTYLQSLNLDPRFYQTIAYDGMTYNSSVGVLDFYRGGDGYSDGHLASSDAGVDGYALETYKFCARVNNMDASHIFWPIFRLAEFYLSYAEALNEYQGPSGDPTFYLNEIRKRAGMPEKHISDINEFRKAVHKERTIELAFENHRYNDLLRWLKAGTVLNGTLHGVRTTAKNIGGTLHRSWDIVRFINRTFPNKYYYIPFPYDEISKNYLGDGKTWNGQNPGW